MRAFWTIAACVLTVVVLFGSFFGALAWVHHVQADDLVRIETGEQ